MKNYLLLFSTFFLLHFLLVRYGFFTPFLRRRIKRTRKNFSLILSFYFLQVQVCFFIQYAPRMSIARTQSSTIRITGGQSMQMGILNNEKSFTLGMSAHILKANMFYVILQMISTTYSYAHKCFHP